MARLVLRADGGPGIGDGHLARCLALGQAWRDSGGEVALVSHDLPPAWDQRYRDEEVELLTSQGAWERGRADWVVLDGYEFGIEAQRRVKAADHRLAVVDDHGACGPYVADVLVDQNLGASPGAYLDRPAGSALLLGPGFALLRREFRTSPVIVREEASRVLVLLGGSPPADAEALVETAVGLIRPATAFRPRDARQVAEAMREADIAVAGAGVTTWELCAMGLPSVLLVLADNQAPVAASVSAAGGAVSLGDWRRVTPDEVATSIRSLLSSSERRRAMSETQRRLVDGRGARRVAARLRADLLDLRDATADDARLLWEWANDEKVRRLSFSPSAISWPDHVAWLEQKLADQATHLYVANDGDDAVGQIRFEASGTEAEIDVSLAAAHRGKGLGGALISAGVRRFFLDSAAPRVVARVRPENVASAEAFDLAGFRLEAEQSDDSHNWLLYARGRDDAEA